MSYGVQFAIIPIVEVLDEPVERPAADRGQHAPLIHPGNGGGGTNGAYRHSVAGWDQAHWVDKKTWGACRRRVVPTWVWAGSDLTLGCALIMIPSLGFL